MAEIQTDAVVNSTKAALEDFKNSSVWEDMIRELELWQENLKGGYDLCENMEQVARIQGRREAIDYILALPDNLIEFVKEKRQKEKEERHARKEDLQSDKD